MSNQTKEQKFYKALQDVFIGAKIEGEGGFVNLMRIKSNYYRKIEDTLKKDIESALKSYPKFKDELFDKLYSFFNRYFTESGSIYFNSTPFHNNIYEKVYTDEKDVILFWKTQMLYYVKTDRIFRSLPVEFDGFKFYFDASKIESKKANEKRSLIFTLNKVREEGTIVFGVSYSEKGTKTKQDEILKSIKRKGIAITEEQLERALKVFEKQSEVDFFINKNAKAFLQEQFKLWSYQYFWEGAKEWGADRVNQLQILKNIAFKIIDFISQFEDELVKIWNKPKFVKNSNYVITLDRILDKKLVEKIKKHKNFSEQVKEWEELGINKDNPKAPIDTMHFKDLEIEILNQFDDLDKSLDGWLIKSENYQALNTILPKFRGKVQTIYIDPPFNLDSTDQFLYRTNYKDSNWATLLENRLKLAKDILNKNGGIFVRCDYNGNWLVRQLMDLIFESNLKNEITIQRGREDVGSPNKLETTTESLFLYGNVGFSINKVQTKRSIANIQWTSFLMGGERRPRERIFFGKKITPPAGQHYSLKQEKVDKLLNEKFLRLRCSNCRSIYYKAESTEELNLYMKKKPNRFKFYDIKDDTVYHGMNSITKCVDCNTDDFKVEYLGSPDVFVSSNWTDIPSYVSGAAFSTENSEYLIERAIKVGSNNKEQYIFDFFLGSGTTTRVSHKLGFKWLGVEMGEHFYTEALPRMKKVLAYDSGGISKEVNDYKGGGFFKYYDLEQYEDVLKNCKYGEGDLFNKTSEKAYQEYVFMKDEKMLKAVEIDYVKDKVRVDLTKLYPNIDIAETLSNLTGKWIKKISDSDVEFEDGTRINIKDLDYKLIKSLIWWE
ncbi:MAG: site-specific DNA-methyltransferase [Lentimicrobiaceae bacterium]|nr:site-specific DNA-methyltransferase [Lentimicrobiaceae bacterium]